MFGLSLFEFLVIVIVGAVLIRPKDLPEVVYVVTKAIMRIQRFFGYLHNQYKNFEDEIGLAKIKDRIREELLIEDLKNNNKSSSLLESKTLIKTKFDNQDCQNEEQLISDSNKILLKEMQQKLIIDNNITIIDVYGQIHLIPQSRVAKNGYQLTLEELQDIDLLNQQNKAKNND